VSATELTDKILACLRGHPDGEPVPLEELARELGCDEDEIVSAATALESRKVGDRDVVSIISRERVSGGKDVFVSRVPTPLNEEPPA
jgi:hypothetical protein